MKICEGIQRMSIYEDDMESILLADYIDWKKLKEKTIVVTGATGLIGSTLIKTLLYVSRKMNLRLRVIALIRNQDKAKKIYETFIKSYDELEFVLGDITNIIINASKIDYIIHGANPTSSQYFVSNPVEVIRVSFEGTCNLLEFAREKKVEGFVYLSTMEVFGTPKRGYKVTEKDAGSFDSTNIRNSYPLSKQLCENLCCSYAMEYGVPAKIVRLCQTFGPGVSFNDRRVFAEFARCAITGENIILKTKGETKRNYLYTADAVAAILTVLLKGVIGQIYTAANEDTFCSIYEMADLVAEKYGIQVVVEEQDISRLGYASTLYLDLDTQKLRNLGWFPKRNLSDMYDRMINVMKGSL